MPRFVVLYHKTGANLDRPDHWDFMLEDGSMLLAWALAAVPAANSPIEALALPAHRHGYLDYEGPLSGNRGSVRQWDAGTFIWQQRDTRRIRVQLLGAKLSGQATLVRRATGDGANSGSAENTPPRRWEFTFAALQRP